MLRALNQLINWLLYTSLHTAACALALCIGTERLLLDKVPPLLSPLHILVVGSTLLEYNVHHLFNHALFFGDQDWSRHSKRWHWVMAIVGGLACLGVLPFLSWPVIGCLGVLGLLSFAYSTPLLPFRFKKRLKDFGLVKITVLTGVWVMVTTVLPILYWAGDFSDLWLELILRFLLIFALCLAFDVRDMAADARNDIDTLPNTIGRKATYRLIDVILLIFLLEGVFQYLRRFQPEHLVDILLTAIAARSAIWYSSRNPHNHVYLGLVDGVMLLYGLLMIF